MVTKQKMLAMKSRLKWVSSEAQMADGVTKYAARQLFADRLRSHHLSLQADVSFQASKKKTLAAATGKRKTPCHHSDWQPQPLGLCSPHLADDRSQGHDGG